jgi:type I restriction enzyme S subunit
MGQACILYGELYTKYKSEVIQKIVSHTNIDSANLVKSKANDVIIPSSGETAIDIATARCVPFPDILLGGDINIIRLKNDNGSFLSYQLNGARKHNIAKVAQGVSIIHLYGDSLKKIKVSVCSHKEQAKIATFLSLLDQHIETQSKIIEKYESLIKGIIDSHHKGCKRKTYFIKELGEYFNVMNLSKDSLSENGRECILYGELFTIYGCVVNEVRSRTTKDDCKLTLSSSSDLLFPSSTTVDAYSLISPSAILKEGVILGGDMFGIRINENFSNEYLSYLFNYIYNRELAKYAKGSTIIHLHYNEIKNVKVNVPSIEEQKKVAGVLRLLQKKLHIEKNLLQTYQKQKRTLLQQMFI